MAIDTNPVVRVAVPNDVAAICQFGLEHIPTHYAPLIGAQAAQDQIDRWWNEAYLANAVGSGQVVVADAAGELVGVGQRGLAGEDHVIYKLYVHPDWRGHGLGPRLIEGLVDQLPPDTDRIYVEVFASNERAIAFYQREGFTLRGTTSNPAGGPAMAQQWRARELPRSAVSP
ncbi:GNAT family N-acetyltransferase [Microlunatus elymi]|uniref:GNAT family N-acetyltransferase n=1 Tax=Microlunatus elymi TaxID=2596828 RepID=A0A516Q6J6_9ACTN|nr:GNAT family N-acetyltransferase [Microlunatus elymi]QDP99012.1 GNAT family N-acetyltransferase [Microlunatus elymi]